MLHLWTSIVPDSVKNSSLLVSIILWDTSASNVQTFVQYAQPGCATHVYGMNEYVNVILSLFPCPTPPLSRAASQPRATFLPQTLFLLGTDTPGPLLTRVMLSEALALPSPPTALIGSPVSSRLAAFVRCRFTSMTSSSPTSRPPSRRGPLLIRVTGFACQVRGLFLDLLKRAPTAHMHL